MKKLSIVIPVYFNQDNLYPLYDDIKAKIIDIIDFEYELVFVDDGSQDKSWDVLQELAKKDPNIKLYKLSRNFGSHAAILCGISNSTGDCVVIKAADLQEPTEIILQMYDSWLQGNNVVLAVRRDREDTSLFSNLYYNMTRKLALPNMPKGGFDIFLLDRKVVKVIELMDERNSAITGQVLWSGFKTSEIYYTRKERIIGKSRWTLKKKLRLVFDTLFSFSSFPITAVSGIGVVSCLISIIWSCVILVGKLLGTIEIEGFTSLMIFQLLSFGITMLTLGVLGNYLWRSFDATRNRPVYIVEDKKL